MSHDDVQLPAAPDEPGVDRRKFLIGTAAASAGMWAAPSILSVDRAFAQVGTDQPPPDPEDCNTSAFALEVMANGPLLGVAELLSSCNNSTGGAPFADASVTRNGTTLVSATVLDTECSQSPRCRAFASVAMLRIDLTSLGIPLELTADLITATAECTSGTTTRSSTIANLTLTANSVPLFAGVAVNSLPNNELVNIAIPGGLALLVILNEQPGSDTVNAIRISATVPVLLSDEVQTVDITIASATASCT